MDKPIDIQPSDFATRRQNLLKKINHNDIILLQSAQVQFRNGDINHIFYQDADFYYLTGLNQPDMLLLLHKDTTENLFVLFMSQTQSKKDECFLGNLPSIEKICQQSTAKIVLPLEKLSEYCKALIKEDTQVYTPPTFPHSWAMQHLDLQPPHQIKNIRPLIHEMRLIKTPSELALMRYAIHISCRAHIRAMQYCKPGCYEYEIEAELQHEFNSHDCRFAAYPSIVAGANRANILHYQNNHAQLHKGDLLLIDAGANYHYYNADITRTFPVDGHFTAIQRDLYQAVLHTQQAVINIIQPGITWTNLEVTAEQAITENLIDLGILSGSLEQQLEIKAYRTYFMHGIGHWLGMDVHDVGDYQINNEIKREERILQAGMVFTVEPGIYIRDDNKTVDRKWLGKGIRIEDNILVTTDGCEILSKTLPKQINAIETLMQN